MTSGDIVTEEQADLLERLEEQHALDVALALYTCQCGARYPMVLKKMNGESATSYGLRYVRCRFCGLTGKIFPRKKNNLTC